QADSGYDSAMSIRTLALLLSPFFLIGCSYPYDVLAVAREGRVELMIDPKSSQQPTCLRSVEVRSGKETMWRESVSHDDNCANEFPIVYGVVLKGKRQQGGEQVIAKPLRRGIVYE